MLAAKPTRIPEKDVETFYYEGNDDWIDFKQTKLPACPSGFKAKLMLKSGKTINAPLAWRTKIWEWWYWTRRGELYRNIMKGASRQIAPRRPGWVI